MSKLLGTSLPGELLEAILARLDSSGLDIYVRADKPKLASCSQTCRRWATFIRPLLWRIITLRTREDEKMFSELLDAPNFLACSIRDCLFRVYRDHDGPVSSIPPFMSLPVIPSISSQHIPIQINWDMREETLPLRTSPPVLPSASLPRLLPRTLLYVTTLNIHGIRGLSIRAFLRLVRCMRIYALILLDVEFGNECELDTIRRVPSPQRRCTQAQSFELQLRRCIKQASSLPFWVMLSEHVVGSQRPSTRDSEASALALQSFRRYLDMEPGKHEPLSLVIRSGYQRTDEPNLIKVRDPPMEIYWVYRVGGDTLLAELGLFCPEGNGELHGCCKYQFPAMHGSLLVSAVSDFWDMLIREDDGLVHGVIIGVDTEQAFRDLLPSILDGHLFTHGPVHLVYAEVSHCVKYSLEQILGAPITVILDDGTEHTLATEERMEHLMSPPHADSVRKRLEDQEKMLRIINALSP